MWKFTKFKGIVALVAVVCATALMPRVSQAQLTFTLADSSTWPSAAEWQDVYNKMTYNCNLYNAFANFGPYNIYVYYNAGIPTEQASYGGYGGSIGVGQQYPQYWNLQHEMSHYLGTGTYWQWPNLMYGGVWHGASANALEQQFDGVGAVLAGDTQHFWPYGLNYATEDSHIAEERHMALDYALLQDMGLEPASPASSATIVTLTASDPVGTSGFNYMDNWSDTHFAHAGANYFTGNYAIRTPADGGSYTFAGNSLTLNNSGDSTQGLFYKGSGITGVITINNLIFNGGSTHHFSTTSDLFQLAGQITLAAGGGTLNSEQGNTNVLAAISGSGNLTIGVTNGNVVTLLAANTFTGTTTVGNPLSGAGTLALGAGGSAGTIRGPLVINSGSLVNLTAADALGFGSGTSVPTVTINGGVLNNAIAGNNSYLTSYVLSGGSITSTGSGPIHFSTGYGVTTLAGSATSVISAPLKIRDQNNLTFNVARGSTPSGIDLSISGAIGNDPYNGGALNAITKTGPGVMTLSGANTYSGGTMLNAGTININETSAIGTGILTIAGSTAIDNTSGFPLTLATNNAQIWNGDFTFGGASALNMGTGAVTMTGNRTVTSNGPGAPGLTVGPIGQSGGSWQLTKAGSGTLVFSGSNSYTGPTIISAGTLQIGTGGASGSIALASSIVDNATLAFNRSNTIAQGIDPSAAISGTGSVVQLGAGTLNLAGSNSYSGGTQIVAGTLVLSGSLNPSP